MTLNLNPDSSYWRRLHEITHTIIGQKFPELSRAKFERVHIRFRNVSSDYEYMITDGKPAPHNLYLNIGLESRLPIYGLAWGDHPQWKVYSARPEKWKIHSKDQIDPEELNDPAFIAAAIRETWR